MMPLLLSTSRERIPTGMVVWPYSTSLLVMVPPVSQRPDDAFRSIGNANGLFHIPTKQKRRSTGQGAKAPLTLSGLKKDGSCGTCGHELSRPKRVSWLLANRMMWPRLYLFHAMG